MRNPTVLVMLALVCAICLAVLVYLQVTDHIRAREVAKVRLEAAEESYQRTLKSIHDEYLRSLTPAERERAEREGKK